MNTAEVDDMVVVCVLVIVSVVVFVGMVLLGIGRVA